MDSSKKMTLATREVPQNSEASPTQPPPPPVSTRQGGESHVGANQLLEQCFPRGSIRRTYHSSPHDFMEYRVRNESPPGLSSTEQEAVQSGENWKLGRGRMVGRGVAISPNLSTCTESSDNGTAAVVAMSTVKISPPTATTSTGSEAAGLKKAEEHAVTSSKGAQQLGGLSKEDELKGDPELNAKLGQSHYIAVRGSTRRRSCGSGRFRPRSFGMGISSRGGTRSLGPSEWTGGYGSHGIRATWSSPSLPRGFIRGLSHVRSDEEMRYPTEEEEERDQQPLSPPPYPPSPTAELANRMARREAETEEDLADKDVDTILKSYFQKYKFGI